MLVTRERGYIWMLRYRHPSWFLSVGAESAAQHSTILATLVAFCSMATMKYHLTN